MLKANAIACYNPQITFNTCLGCQLDFFVVSYLNYLVMGLETQVYMEFKQCTPLNYATEEMLRWMEADTKAVSHILEDQREDWSNQMAEMNAKIKLPGPLPA